MTSRLEQLQTAQAVANSALYRYRDNLRGRKSDPFDQHVHELRRACSEADEATRTYMRDLPGAIAYVLSFCDTLLEHADDDEELGRVFGSKWAEITERLRAVPE
jgi:hypothetical protein